MTHDNDNSNDKQEHGARQTETDFELEIRFDDETEWPAEDAGKDGNQQPEPKNAALEDVNQQIAQLSQAFETKLKYDGHKNKVIDELHQELQEYRDGLVKKYIHSMVTDVIKIIDDIRKFKAYYEPGPITEQTAARLLEFLEEIAGDLEDLFTWQGITAFTCGVTHFDNTRQRVVKKVETSDPTLDKTIAESMRPGYEWDGKILRPELVTVYVYDSSGKGDRL
jgi:molecular chaperone GrpE (heat shock protein)